MIRRFLHWLGFHGANQYCAWYEGNVWTECTICGERQMISFADASEIPLSEIEPQFRNSGD